MSQRGNPYAHYCNSDGRNYVSPIHEAAAHPFSAYEMEMVYEKVLQT